jgi:hypothetical protein
MPGATACCSPTTLPLPTGSQLHALTCIESIFGADNPPVVVATLAARAYGLCSLQGRVETPHSASRNHV